MTDTKDAPSIPQSTAEAMAQLERPQFKWKVVAQIVGALTIVWVTAFILVPYTNYWAVGLASVVTVAAMGFGLYVWRLTRRSQAVVDIMKSATDDASRRAAIDKLAEAGTKDVMKVLARAQLVAQSKPLEALEILEQIDLSKAPAMLQDDIRSQRAMLYLRGNRIRDAREMVDEIRLDRQPNAKSKAMYAAVSAESFARTGKVDEAQKLLQTYSPDEAAYGESRALLLRAQVYTCFALKKRGLAQNAMRSLAAIDPNLLGGFVQKGTQPELMKMAKQVLASSGAIPRPKIKHMR